jgi:pimeloyl-ACP methyl ester carboxylesterase
MIEEARGSIDYDETGSGPTIVLVPGSCSTGAAWRSVIGEWDGRYRCVTTSLLGYGGTSERRTADDASIFYEAEILEAVIRRAGGKVHVVGHSFGGGIALLVALRKRVPLASLTIFEAPAVEILRAMGEHDHYRTFRAMTDAYFTSFERGNRQAIATMIDFFGGDGTFASWPPRLREYAIETTPVNILDWASAYGFPISPLALATVDVPTIVLCGGASHPAVHRACELLSECIPGASLATIEGAAHFMISTHPKKVARLIVQHIDKADAAHARALDPNVRNGERKFQNRRPAMRGAEHYGSWHESERRDVH